MDNNMDKHVVSLKLSKELKNAGWKKETAWYWSPRSGNWPGVMKPDFFLPGGEAILFLKPQNEAQIFVLEKEISDFRNRYMNLPVELPICPGCKGNPRKNCEICKGESWRKR